MSRERTTLGSHLQCQGSDDVNVFSVEGQCSKHSTSALLMHKAVLLKSVVNWSGVQKFDCLIATSRSVGCELPFGAANGAVARFR